MKPMVCGAVLYNPWDTQIEVDGAKGLTILHMVIMKKLYCYLFKTH